MIYIYFYNIYHMSQFRIMPYFGFTFGIVLGFIARDTYTFTMGEKMDLINNDYKIVQKNIENKIERIQGDIKIMRARAVQLQKNYLQIKQRVIDGE